LAVGWKTGWMIHEPGRKTRNPRASARGLGRLMDVCEKRLNNRPPREHRKAEGKSKALKQIFHEQSLYRRSG
jgi:hypothetical protein